MTLPVRFSGPASEEFRAAVTWYETRRRGLGAEFLDATADTVRLIQRQPEAGSPAFKDPRTRRTLIRRFPYQLVYRLGEVEIVILAVAHLKRRPGYWKHRS
ncbi:MAG: type II toxin-antitoxin system RelE/ParE family toxin [Acidobacteria bacterium]|nr:type II toxin-antitoxin system RelE/ParE family toxin [Acidobacteriota bacterium]